MLEACPPAPIETDRCPNLRAEYFARYNLGEDVPFEPYTNGIVSYTAISSASRGAIRPAWEILYNHYAVIKGLDAPWTTKYLNNTLTYFGGAEGGAGSWGEGSGHYDGLGWGTLLYRLDASDISNTSTATNGSVSANNTITSASTTATTTTVTSASPTTSNTTSVGPIKHDSNGCDAGHQYLCSVDNQHSNLGGTHSEHVD